MVLRLALCVTAMMLAACKGGDSGSPVEAPGAEKSAGTTTLEAGAAMLQSQATHSLDQRLSRWLSFLQRQHEGADGRHITIARS